MDDPATITAALNAITPLGLAGGLAYIIYLLIKTNKGQNKIANNHLHGLPDMHETLKRIEENQRGQLELLNDIAKGQEYIKARLNGRGK